MISEVYSEPGPTVIRSARSMASSVSGSGAGVGRVERQLHDAPAAGGDVGLAAHQRAVVHVRHQRGVGGGGRIDAAARGQNLRGQLHGLGKVAGDLGERGHKQVAEVVALERIAAAEAMGEQPRQQILFLAEGDHAVAQVAGGQHLKSWRSRPDEPPSSVTVTTAARSAIGAGLRRALAGRGHVLAQAAQQGGEAGAAADGHHAQGPCDRRVASRPD